MENDLKYMEKALNEAKKSLKTGDVPIGAIIVKDNKIIASAYNTKEKYQISTKHAEINAIEKACTKLKSWHLDDCDIYITVEPCLMCAGAILQSRIKKVVYGIPNAKFGYIESIDQVLTNSKNNHKPKIKSGILEKQITEIMQDFFKEKRK